MPITANGDFEKMELDDLRELINGYFRQKYGNVIDLSDDQTPGQLAGSMSYWSEYLEKEAQGILSSFFLWKSQGYQTDDIGGEIGLFRKSASYASVELQIDGYVDPDSPTIITAPTDFSTADGHIFEIADDVTITQQAMVKDDNGNDVPLVDEDGNPLGRAMVSANAVESGSDSNVMPNSIINPEESVDGFYAVTNPEAATGGGDAETDNEFKLRIDANRQTSKGSNKSAIETAIKNVSGVKDARLVNNRYLTTDKYGNPPKSGHLYVIGGDSQTIADTYSVATHALAHTVGTIEKTVTDIGGKVEEFYFDRAKTVPIFIQLDIDADSTAFDVDGAPDTIKQNILQYFDTLLMGDPVLYSRLFGPVYNVAGVRNVVITLGTDKAKLTATDTTVDEFELAVTSADNITINLKGV